MISAGAEGAVVGMAAPSLSQIESHYTPQEVAKKLAVTPQTVCRMFRDVPGVIEFGSDESRFRRKRKFMRIPHSALTHFLESKRTAR